MSMCAEVLARLDMLRARVGAFIDDHEATSTDADHPLRGLYLSREQAVRLVARLDEGRCATDFRALPLGPQLSALADRCGLDCVDIDILLTALAPDVDPAFEKLYGFVHDDLTKRSATIGLAMQLSGLPMASPHRSRFAASAGLSANALIVVDDDGPFLARSIRVPDHVTAFLVGADRVEGSLRPFVIEPTYVASPDVAGVLGALDRSSTRAGSVIHLSEATGGGAAHVAATAAWAAGRSPLVVDVTAAPTEHLDAVVAAALRHRALTGDVLIIRPVETVADHARGRLGQLTAGAVPTVLIGSAGWDRSWSAVVPDQLPIGPLGESELTRIWHQSLVGVDVDVDAVELVQRTFRLTPEQIMGAARTVIAESRGADQIGFAVLSAAARAQSASGLDRLARRLEPSARWDDLILPDDVMTMLGELAIRVRWRDQVMQEWGLGPGWRGRGIAALFAGPSGTGKTTAAEVVAGELGYDIHVVDLSVVVDKYIGETEKKLEVIFTEAERTNTVLLFDEADSIFGKRSEVKDARDRYANIEVSYLLQRIERFAGLAILTTNLGANLDDAFTRRLDLVVDFPRPNAAARERIWRHEFRPGVPTDGIDFEFCATAFELTGGNIRNVVITAAYLAAEARTPVTMAEVVAAVQREYRKMGRLLLPAEFGTYGSLLR